MCGIAGFSGRPVAEIADTVLDALGHRGPDGRGRFNSSCGFVSLFQTRLAIIDPTPDGAQPMTTPDGLVTISFNGEIYNFRELRAELQAQGYIFRSHTDTEVLLALYLRHGTAMLERLNGIFAFGIWDARSKSLFVARDALGVKPLYFSESGNSFAFASEIKALLCFPWISRTLDLQALAHYVRYLWCPAPRTPLTEVKKLEPGKALIVRDGKILKHWRYYTLPAPGPDMSRSVADWTAEVREVLERAVERQMVSDVPLGAFLSGGLDSSAVVAFARRHTRETLQCFTIDFDDDLAEEEGVVTDLPYAQCVAKQLHVDLHVGHVGSEIASGLEWMVQQLDEPLADFAALNAFFIARVAREHGIKVLLSGAGGDDLFTGYRRHRALGLDVIWDNLPVRLRRFAAAIGRNLPGRPPSVRQAAKLLNAAGLNGDERLASYFDWASPSAVRSLLLPELAQATSLDEEPLLEALKEAPQTATTLQRMLLLEQRYFLADHNLNYTDKMCMAVGVEARVPFLDLEVMDLAARIPDGYRQHGAAGKWILKKAMEGILPDHVIYRPKTGFGVPFRSWLRGPLNALVHDVLSSESLRKRGIFDSSAVAQLLKDEELGRTDHAYSVLSLMCIELWCRGFLDNKLRPNGQTWLNCDWNCHMPGVSQDPSPSTVISDTLSLT